MFEKVLMGKVMCAGGGTPKGTLEVQTPEHSGLKLRQGLHRGLWPGGLQGVEPASWVA